MITKERISKLLASFGKEKEHYQLKKIKTKLQKYFGYSLEYKLQIALNWQKNAKTNFRKK